MLPLPIICWSSTSRGRHPGIRAGAREANSANAFASSIIQAGSNASDLVCVLWHVRGF